MPLVEIHALPQPPDVVERVLRRAAAEIASSISARPDAVWVTWTAYERYAVGQHLASEQPTGSQAPVVHVYARRTEAEIERLADAVERTLVEELRLDDGNVFVTVQPVYLLDAAVADD